MSSLGEKWWIGAMWPEWNRWGFFKNLTCELLSTKKTDIHSYLKKKNKIKNYKKSQCLKPLFWWQLLGSCWNNSAFWPLAVFSYVKTIFFLLVVLFPGQYNHTKMLWAFRSLVKQVEFVFLIVIQIHLVNWMSLMSVLKNIFSTHIVNRVLGL